MVSVKKYRLTDPAQELDDRAFWEGQTVEYRLDALEALRHSWLKLNPDLKANAGIKRFRRLSRTAEQA